MKAFDDLLRKCKRDCSRLAGRTGGSNNNITAHNGVSTQTPQLSPTPTTPMPAVSSNVAQQILGARGEKARALTSSANAYLQDTRDVECENATYTNAQHPQQPMPLERTPTPQSVSTRAQLIALLKTTPTPYNGSTESAQPRNRGLMQPRRCTPAHPCRRKFLTAAESARPSAVDHSINRILGYQRASSSSRLHDTRRTASSGGENHAQPAWEAAGVT